MKLLKYNLIARVHTGTMDEPVWEETKGADVTMGYSDANLAIAQSEAWQGLVDVVDDGQPEPETPASAGVTWDELAAAIQEGVNTV